MHSLHKRYNKDKGTKKGVRVFKGLMNGVFHCVFGTLIYNKFHKAYKEENDLIRYIEQQKYVTYSRLFPESIKHVETQIDFKLRGMNHV